MIWDMWKQGFAAWETATSQYMEKVAVSHAANPCFHMSQIMVSLLARIA